MTYPTPEAAERVARTVEHYSGETPRRRAADMIRALVADLGVLRAQLAEAQARPVAKPGQIERIVWSAMVWAVANPGAPDETPPEYTDGGNSFAETEARSAAKRILDCLEPRPVTVGEVKNLRDVLRQCVDVQRRVQEDTYWRTPDNTLWPDLCKATNAALRALTEGESE